MLHLRAPRARPRLVTATALALVAASIASCGGSSSGGRLSRASASDLRSTLDQIEQDVGAGNCTGAAQEAASLQQQVDSLDRVGSSLRGALRASARRLSSLVADQCQATTTAPTQTQTTPQESKPAGPPGQQKKKGKKPKPGKGPKGPPTDTTPTTPGTGDKQPPASPDTGGGAGLPGETNQGQ